MKVLHLFFALGFLSQEAMALGKKKASPPPPEPMKEEESLPTPPPMPAEMLKGLEYLDQKDFEIASLIFHEVLKNPDYSYYHLLAKNHLAMCLERMGYPASALSFYAEILKVGPETPYFATAYERGVRLSLRVSDESTLVEALQDVSPDFFPPFRRDLVFYWMGRELFERERNLLAKAFLTAIASDREAHPPGQIILGVLLAKEGRFKEAVNTLSPILGLAGDLPGKERLVDLANLNIGRIFYAHKRYDRSKEFFLQVQRSSLHWPEALFEAAWSSFMAGDLNDCLALLQTLTSPFFREFYLPEALLLKTTVLYYLCKFSEGTKIIKEFLDIYTPLDASLKKLLADHGEDPAFLFDRVVSFLQGKGGDPIPPSLLRLFLPDERLRRAGKHREALRIEVGRLKDAKGSWGRSDLAQEAVFRLREMEKKEAQREGKRIAERLQGIKQDLSAMVAQTQINQLEMLTKEKEFYDAGMAGLLKGPPPPPARRFYIPSGHYYWPFQGEYWLDEIGYYQVSSPKECPEIDTGEEK